MKFLCDNCKAKYQIADEKVAGKTVRMKCRKCGHQIEVRAAVTETSVASAPPRAPATGAPAAAAPKPAQRNSLATSLSATKPKSPSIAPNSALGGAFKSAVREDPSGPVGDKPGIELSVTDEWYVAINGVPVGPVRISELRRKAAAGAVTEESLCWQEGLEEWRPIKSIPELAALVREAAQGNRPSLIGTAPAPVAATSPSSPPATVEAEPRSPPSAPRQAVARGTTPPPGSPRILTTGLPSAPPVSPRSNVVPLRPAASGGLGLDARSSSDDIGLGPIGASGAAPAFSLTPAPPAPLFTPPPQPLASPLAAPDPFAVPSAPIAAPLVAPYSTAPSLAPAPPAYVDTGERRGVPLWFWPILVVALGFGGGVAFLVFRPQPAPAPVVIQMPATATATTTQPSEVPPPPTSAEPATVASSEPGKPAPAKPSGPIAKAGPKAPVEEKKGLDLGNLGGLGGNGPSTGGPGSPGAASGGGLDQAGVERVVAQHRNAVKRTCWERGGEQKSSVNVTVTANVAPNGTVSSTSSSGNDPVVAKCIENQVKSWTFPAPGSNTTINIPFKFIPQ